MGVTVSRRQIAESVRRSRKNVRNGLSLIEVIACTTIVAVLLVPIAAVVKDSGRTIRRLETDATTTQSLRSSSNWLRDTLRPCSILAIANSDLEVQLPSGTTAGILRKGRDLVLDDGVNVSVICKDIEDVRFQPLLTTDIPARRVGLTMTITARDAVTGATSSMLTTIANSR